MQVIFCSSDDQTPKPEDQKWDCLGILKDLQIGFFIEKKHFEQIKTNIKFRDINSRFVYSGSED